MIDSEGALLGSCLASPEAMNYVFYHVPEESILEPQNKALLGLFKRMFKAGIAVDSVTAIGSLRDLEKSTIGVSYVLGLAEAVPVALNVRHYAALVRKNAAVQMLAKCYDRVKADPQDLATQKEIRRLWDTMNGDENAVIDAREATLRYADTIEARRNGKHDRILSGYSQLDRIVGGFYRGNMVILGARTSVGKTSFLLNMAINFIRSRVKVLFVSAEMTWDELLDRIVASESGVFVSRLRHGDLNESDNLKVSTSLAEISEMPLHCIEGGKMSMSRIRLACEIVRPDVIVVDFIQRFNPPTSQNRAAFFSDIANDLKALAMEKKIVVVAASQMNREIEKTERRDPQLSDLKESGGIEEAADAVILLQADKEENAMLPEKTVVFHVKKNRHGPTGKVDFTFHKTQTKFVEKIIEVEERSVYGE